MGGGWGKEGGTMIIGEKRWDETMIIREKRWDYDNTREEVGR